MLICKKRFMGWSWHVRSLPLGIQGRAIGVRALKSADLFLVPSHPSEATTPSRHLLIRMTRVATLAEKRLSSVRRLHLGGKDLLVLKLFLSTVERRRTLSCRLSGYKHDLLQPLQDSGGPSLNLEVDTELAAKLPRNLLWGTFGPHKNKQ